MEEQVTTRTPPEISDKILELCDRIDSGPRRPLFLDITGSPGCLLSLRAAAGGFAPAGYCGRHPQLAAGTRQLAGVSHIAKCSAQIVLGRGPVLGNCSAKPYNFRQQFRSLSRNFDA